MAVARPAAPPSPMPCYEPEEWERYTAGLVYEVSVHYAPSSMRRQFGVTDVMVSACLDCVLAYQRQALLSGICRPPAHYRPITPLERLEAERAADG